MQKGIIRRLNKELPKELYDMETYFISQAENNTDFYLNKYKELSASFNGNYICSDLFKETFDEYTQSIENRKLYAEVIHNSAAVLANEMFHEKAGSKDIKRCIFISGVPGAGKSFLIQSLIMSGAIDEDTMIYEGDISSRTIYEKIDVVINNNIKPYIMIVNPTLELAQRNAIMRHYEIGRGASCQTMARILSKIPIALNEIKERYPNIELGIYNKKTNYDIENYVGFENAELLNHGDYDTVLEELQKLRIEILKEIENDLKKKKLDQIDEVDTKGEIENETRKR